MVTKCLLRHSEHNTILSILIYSSYYELPVFLSLNILFILMPKQRVLLVGSEVLTAMVMKSYIFWNVTPCNPLTMNQRFGRTCRLHL
jgi:hypothetical protein